ncbi:MAG TPA: RNB domain-containing ribonuclease, partial [Marmoricola sp.]|nr:RNB domain-containing ribonuclease [Marmoricola sp.]
RANAYENAVLNLVEAATLQHRVGERFEAVVLEAEHDDARKGTVMVHDPAVEARVTSHSPLPVGDQVTVRLAEADVAGRVVRFEV